MTDPHGNFREILTEIASTPRNADMEAATGETDPLENVGETGFPDLKELRETFEEVSIAPIVEALTRPIRIRNRGRRPYPRGPMIRAFLSMPVLDIADISALHWELMNNPALRTVCEFTTSVPSRPTFSRVFNQLRKMDGLLDECLAEAVRKLKDCLPDLGREVAVDSTMIKTNSNPKREPLSDPEASWGKKSSARETRGQQWVYGYKPHMASDANYDIPLVVDVTKGSESDMNHLIPLVERLEWKPEVVMADRGYDSKKNSEWLHKRGIAPVIHKKKPPMGYHTRARRRKYSTKGTPLCECGHKRPFTGTDTVTGERVYGPVKDCDRVGKLKGFSRCEMEVRVNPEDDIRLFGGAFRGDGPQWKMTYRKRWSVERVFSRWKKRGILENHSFRGLSRVRLLVQLYAIASVAAKLVEVKNSNALPMAA